MNPGSSFNKFRPLDKISAVMMKRVGESGSPYFNPLVDLEKSKDFPLITTKYQLLDTNIQTISKSTSKNQTVSTLL